MGCAIDVINAANHSGVFDLNDEQAIMLQMRGCDAMKCEVKRDDMSQAGFHAHQFAGTTSSRLQYSHLCATHMLNCRL